MRAITIAIILLALPACGAKRVVITKPVMVEIPVEVVVRVPSALTEPPEIPSGPLSQCPAIAAQRRTELEECAGQLRAIREQYGDGE
jgi:hypothetical protein